MMAHEDDCACRRQPLEQAWARAAGFSPSRMPDHLSVFRQKQRILFLMFFSDKRRIGGVTVVPASEPEKNKASFEVRLHLFHAGGSRVSQLANQDQEWAAVHNQLGGLTALLKVRQGRGEKDWASARLKPNAQLRRAAPTEVSYWPHDNPGAVRHNGLR